MADITREEQYLSAIANGSTNVPEPVTREEQYLYQIANSGGGGGGGGSNVAFLEFELVNGIPKSVNTCGEIKSFVDSGKALIGKIIIDTNIISQLNVAFTNFGSTSSSESNMVVFGWDDGSKQITSLALIAATYDSKFELVM